jgi:hypothetical protein
VCPNSGEEFYAVDSPLNKNLEAMWETQPELFHEADAFAAHLSTFGPKHSTLEYSPDLDINDTTDGVEFARCVSRARIEHNTTQRPRATDLLVVLNFADLSHA